MRNGKERAIHAGILTVFAVVVVFALGGCVAEAVVGRVAAVVAKPVLGLAVRDAETTKAWVAAEETAGRLTGMDVALANACPDAVIAVSALRKRLEEAQLDSVDGFKGLIYLATKLRFGQSAKEEATFLVQGLIAACGPLVPADRLIRGF